MYVCMYVLLLCRDDAGRRKVTEMYNGIIKEQYNLQFALQILTPVTTVFTALCWTSIQCTTELLLLLLMLCLYCHESSPIKSVVWLQAHTVITSDLSKLGTTTKSTLIRCCCWRRFTIGLLRLSVGDVTLSWPWRARHAASSSSSCSSVERIGCVRSSIRNAVLSVAGAEDTLQTTLENVTGPAAESWQGNNCPFP